MSWMRRKRSRRRSAVSTLLLCIIVASTTVSSTASCNCSERSLVGQVWSALGGPRTNEELASRLIDDRFEYLREEADVSMAETDVGAVDAMVRGVSTLPPVPVIDLQSSSFNTSALCAFLTKAVPALREAPNVRAFVLLTLGSAAHGCPFHPAILRELDRSCGLKAADLEALLMERKLRRWFASQHFPLVDNTWSDHPKRDNQHAEVGDIKNTIHWVLHAKLHHVPIGLPKIFSKKFEREKAWLEAARRPSCCLDDVYVNFKPRRYREAILETLRRRLKAALPNRYVGKDRVRTRNADDTRAYVDSLFSHRFALSPPGSGIDCYRHWEAILCGAIPIVEYNPLAVELLAGFPVVFVRSWHELSAPYLKAQYDTLSKLSFNYERITTKYWKAELQRAKGATHHLTDSPAAS